MDTESARLLALARRCEEASGGSWELNAKIAVALGWQQSIEKSPTPPYSVRAWKRPDGTLANALPDWSGGLDAALSLVPEGWSFWHLSKYSDGPAACTIYPSRAALDEPVGELLAATPALALCAAALKARAAIATLATPPATGREREG